MIKSSKYIWHHWHVPFMQSACVGQPQGTREGRHRTLRCAFPAVPRLKQMLSQRFGTQSFILFNKLKFLTTLVQAQSAGRRARELLTLIEGGMVVRGSLLNISDAEALHALATAQSIQESLHKPLQSVHCL